MAVRSNVPDYQKQRQVEALMQAGKGAYRKGDRRDAHDLWREAATLNPYDEQIWLALYRVLETDADRIVCLENIIAINPGNVEARRRLRVLHDRDATPAFEPDDAPDLRARIRAKRPRNRVVLFALVIVFALLIGVGASLLLFAR